MWVVVPPQAMPRVSSSGPSVSEGVSGCDMMPWARWVCGSTPPGRHDEPGGVDDPGRVAGQRAGSAQHRDASVLHAHVPGAHTLGRDDASAADHEIEHAPSLAQAAEGVK